MGSERGKASVRRLRGAELYWHGRNVMYVDKGVGLAGRGLGQERDWCMIRKQEGKRKGRKRIQQEKD